MPRRAAALLTLLVASLLLAACGLATVDDGADPADIPDGPLEAMGPAAIGQVTELGRGRTTGIGWRYSTYESTDGTCTQLELAGTGGTSCGPIDEAFGDGVIGGVGRIGGGPREAGDTATAVDGLVTAGVAAVWIVTETGERIPTNLMSMAPAGHDAQAFVGFVPGGATISAVVATDGDGKVIGTFEEP